MASFDFENVYFFGILWILKLQLSQVPHFQAPTNLAWAGLGRA